MIKTIKLIKRIINKCGKLIGDQKSSLKYSVEFLRKSCKCEELTDGQWIIGYQIKLT